MRIKIAGLPIELTCAFPENYGFFRDYASDEPPAIAIAPQRADLERMQAGFDQMDEVEGQPKHRRDDRFLETNAVHMLLAEALATRGAMMIHGSALCMDGQAVIFTAKSGTGKSTHARLWREAFGGRVWMINDDKPMIRTDEMRVYGTPWDGKHRLSTNASAPLKAIVSLERADANHIEPMDRAEAFLLLMRQSYRPKEPAAMTAVLEQFRRLLDGAAFYRLGCNMDPEAAIIARKGIFDEAGTTHP